MRNRLFDIMSIPDRLATLTGIAFFCLSTTCSAQVQPKAVLATSEIEVPLLRILAAGCGIFLVEETEVENTNYLQAFELEGGSSIALQPGELVRVLSTGFASEGTGANTYQRYLSRLETTTAANINDYQFLQMETETGDLFRARQEAFLSIFPDQNRNIQVDSIMSLCPDIEGLEEALLLLE